MIAAHAGRLGGWLVWLLVALLLVIAVLLGVIIMLVLR